MITQGLGPKRARPTRLRGRTVAPQESPPRESNKLVWARVGRSTGWLATADVHHAAAQDGRLLLDVVVREGVAVLELLPVEDESLRDERGALLVLNLGLDVASRSVGLGLRLVGLDCGGLGCGGLEARGRGLRAKE